MPIKNFGEKGAWAYPGTAQIFRLPPIISVTGKTMDLKVGGYIYRANPNKSPLKILETRKLCYRKDDRAMRSTYGCPENFRDSLTMPTATVPNIFMGFCSDRPYECSYKF